MRLYEYNIKPPTMGGFLFACPLLVNSTKNQCYYKNVKNSTKPTYNGGNLNGGGEGKNPHTHSHYIFQNSDIYYIFCSIFVTADINSV